MGKAKNLLFTACLEHFGQIRPDSHIWLFSSTDNSHYNYNSRYLFEYVKENLPKITPLFVINDPELRNSLSSKYGKQYFIETESIQGIRQALSAGVWFTSAGLPAYGTGLHKKRLIINLWHGVPLKKIALLDPNLKKAARIYFKKIFSENYTCILTTSHELIPLMARSFAVSEDKIKVWGQPRNDGLFQKNDCREILGQLFPDLPEYTKTVLYAPTFRDYGQVQLFPFKDFDQEQLEAFLDEKNMLLFIRTHVAEQGSAAPYLGKRIRFLGNEQAEDVTGILNIFDCLITDYSSIYIDYLLTDKPMIFLPYDRQQYLDGRGMNFDYDDVTPGPKPETFNDFLDALSPKEDFWKSERTRVNRLFNEIQHPCAADICNKVLKMIW
ncbi:teichoic acid biosynthesis protein TagF [Blautia obeum]|jgi:CDP-glycerol glycerophosphotransferase|uniref:Teichoic acid biosynthesis protein TagF n=1 Tax=Blautia obeum TaxID=40520 RepID=A0A4Q5GKU6_9FIRM|nr:CDP-glycerol glycerophosphotransferase family protein [Blautia obeum]MZT67993.1 teichoic acid biosynthesis protein TagF [Blautia obeum]RYT68987.1 teichoic acid biosynthesis protein TagF [Blautia obeum]